MGAPLAELALVHDENGVGALDGGEPVGDEDGGAAGDHAREGEADAKFGVGIDGGGGFIEDEDAGVVGEGAGEADELLLSGGEGRAAFAYRFAKICSGSVRMKSPTLTSSAGAFEALVR